MNARTLRLHIKEEKLEIGTFRRSFSSFAAMVQALSEDAAPMATWLASVDKGSMVMSVELVTEEKNVDLEPMFRVIQGNVASLSTGAHISSCPKKARDEYKKLVAAVGSTADQEPKAEILSFAGPGCAETIMPVTIAHEDEVERSDYSAVGAITGKVCSLTTKKGHKLTIVDESTGRSVVGTFDDEMIDEVRRSFDRRATVSGIIKYRPDGTIASMGIRGVLVRPEPAPKLSDLFGILEA